MMNIRSIEDRYRDDSVFRNIVDVLQSMLENQESLTFTPTEMREAAMLAQILFESRHVRPIIIDREKFRL